MIYNNIKIFQQYVNSLKWWKSIVMLTINRENLKTPKCHIF